MQTLANYINGQNIAPVSGQYIDDIDPATGLIYAATPDSDERDVESAVCAAKNAFDTWSNTPIAERSRVLLRLAELIETNLDDLARAECIDTGKPLTLARMVDIPRAAANFRFFATAILHTHSEMHMTDTPAPGIPGTPEGSISSWGGGALNYTLRSPLGVVGCISPWNLPLYLLSWKIAPALATGNTVIAKPSEVTPMTAFMLGELCQQADLPPGVLNIVHGLGTKVGAAIVAHPKIAAISFTGGTKTGAEIARVASPMFKKVSLELGGKNPNIIFNDADLDETISVSLRSSFANQGQICLCGSRLFIEQSIYKEFVARFIDETNKLRVGDPLEPETQQGAVVSEQHLNKIKSAIDLARDEGGTILAGGQTPAPDELPQRCRDGFFMKPTVIADLDPRCRTNMEEIFGPVVTITPFEHEDEVIELANATEYGLSASIWTKDVSRAHRLAARIEAGTVWVNCWLLRDLRVPFGGMKSSGVGREGGEEALRFFTEAKNVCVKI